jgi:two-component system cell cycle sensor histidine kinase/response regulator CckA
VSTDGFGEEHGPGGTVVRAVEHVHPLRTVRAHRRRILVVDDEPSVRTFVECVLRDEGYVTMVASDGPEALTILANDGPFDVLVTDVVMPQMGGDELARRVRQAAPTIKVLYVTGSPDRLFQTKPNLSEGEALLEKPCADDALNAAVSSLLNGHRPQRRPARTANTSDKPT